MKRNLKEKDILKSLRDMAKASPDGHVFERVWYKLEDRIASRTHQTARHLTWKPWMHPVRWVAAACLCLAISGVLYQQHVNYEGEDMADYLMSISNPTANIGHDLGVVKVPILLTGPSNSGAGIVKIDDEHSDVLKGDEILL